MNERERDKLPPCPDCEEHRATCEHCDEDEQLDKEVDEVLDWPLTDRDCDVNNPEDCDSCQ